MRDGDMIEAGREAVDVVVLLHRVVGISGWNSPTGRRQDGDQPGAQMENHRRRNRQPHLGAPAPNELKDTETDPDD